jgi:hypothetical protein
MMKFDVSAVYFTSQNTKNRSDMESNTCKSLPSCDQRKRTEIAIEIGRDDKNGRARPLVMAAYLASHEKYASLYEKLAE